MKNWKSELRSPLGQVRLLALTLVGAAVFAGVLGTQTGWFESWIREKPPVTSAATVRLAQDITAGEDVPLDRADLERLYAMWLVADELPGAKVATTLTRKDQEWFHERVERTLVAGNAAQRIRSLELIATTKDQELVPVLERALSRYERIGPEEVVEPCKGTLRKLTAGAGG